MANNKEPDNAIEDFLPLEHSFFRFLPLINYGLLFERRIFFPKSTFCLQEIAAISHMVLAGKHFCPDNAKTKYWLLQKSKSGLFTSIQVSVLLVLYRPYSSFKEETFVNFKEVLLEI